MADAASGGGYWQKTLDVIRPMVSPATFVNFFSQDTIINATKRNNRLTVRVADEIAQAYMEQAFTALIQEAAFQVSGNDLRVVFEIYREKEKK
jgi:chromosomal replication initiation ATPase DnaA